MAVMEIIVITVSMRRLVLKVNVVYNQLFYACNIEKSNNLTNDRISVIHKPLLTNIPFEYTYPLY